MPNTVPTAFVFGEAMIELSGGENLCLGVAGDTFNTAVYLARAGIKARYATALGDDPYSARIMDALRAQSVDTHAALIVDGGTAGLYAIDVDESGERSFTYWRSASAARSFFKARGADKIIAEMKTAKMLYLSGITLSIFTAEERSQIIDIARTVKKGGGNVVFDTNYRPRGWDTPAQARTAVRALMPYVSTALLTWEDERDLFGDESAKTCAARWTAAGAAEVIVKAGKRGAFNEQTGWVPPPRVLRPVDTTGAGDSFNGAYLAARLCGKSINASIIAGHELAAQVLMVGGAILPKAQ